MTEFFTSDIVNGEDNEEQLETLILLVQERKNLYDASSNSNKNKVLKEQAWTEISTIMKMSVLWCQCEWKKLRENYRKKMKILKGKSGQGRQKIESWSHFQSMTFLNEFLKTAETSGNMTPTCFWQEASQTTNQQTDEDRLEGCADVSQTQSGNGERQPNVPFGENQPVVNNNESNNKRLITIPEQTEILFSRNAVPAKKPKRAMDKVDEEIIKLLKKPNEPLDVNHHFCLTVSDSLQKISKKNASAARIKILEVVHQYQFEEEDE